MSGENDPEERRSTHPMSLRGSRARVAYSFWLSTRLAFVLAWALLAVPRSAQAVEILPSDAERTILADAQTARDLEFSIETNGDGALDLLPLDAAVIASAAIVDVSADADADQQSQIDLTELVAAGMVGASVSIAPAVSGASTSATGDSVYRVVFSVDLATTFVLSGHVEASTLPAQGDTFAIVELVDLDTLDILFSFTESDGGRTDFSETIDLVPGVNYELYAAGLAVAEGLSPDTTESIFASYSVSLLPEPGTISGILVGCLALGLLERRRRPRSS